MPFDFDHIQLSQASGVPFYRQIQDQIAEAVRAGQLEGGDRLPSARALAERLRVSNITTRRAYQELENDGIIVSQQGRGTFVTEQVTGAAAARGRRQAVAALEEAIERARRLGLDDEQIRSVLEARLRTREDA